MKKIKNRDKIFKPMKHQYCCEEVFYDKYYTYRENKFIKYILSIDVFYGVNYDRYYSDNHGRKFYNLDDKKYYPFILYNNKYYIDYYCKSKKKFENCDYYIDFPKKYIIEFRCYIERMLNYEKE
jgi:hypothetical protein